MHFLLGGITNGAGEAKWKPCATAGWRCKRSNYCFSTGHEEALGLSATRQWTAGGLEALSAAGEVTEPSPLASQPLHYKRLRSPSPRDSLCSLQLILSAPATTTPWAGC